MPPNDDTWIANSQVRQTLIAAQEVLGPNILNEILISLALIRYVGNFPPDDLNPGIRTSEFAHLNKAIETQFERGGRGILRIIGQATFQHVLRNESIFLGLAGKAMKLLPQRQRIRITLESMANAQKKTNPRADTWVEETSRGFTYIDRTCIVCFGQRSVKPTCHLTLGIISEAVRWAAGNNYEVRETHCIAKGEEYCRFEVSKRP